MKKSAVKIVLKLFLSFTVISVLISMMDIALLKESLATFKASAWVYALLFIMMQTALLSWRWMTLINIGHYRMNFMESFQVTLASAIANILLIATISGLAVRIALACQYGASLFKSITATLIDRIMTTAALLILCIIFLPTLSTLIDTKLFQEISLFVSIFSLFLFVISPFIFFSIIKKMPLREGSKGTMRSGIRYLKILSSQPRTLGKVMGISLSAQICFFLSVFCITVSSQISLSFLEIMTVLPAIAFVSSLPFTIGGWGVRESAFIFGLGVLGVPMEEAFSISLQVGLIGLLSTIVMGLPALLTIDADIFKLKKAKV